MERELQVHSCLNESRTASFMSQWNVERDLLNGKTAAKTAKQTWLDMLTAAAKKAKKSDVAPTLEQFVLAATEIFAGTEVND